MMARFERFCASLLLVGAAIASRCAGQGVLVIDSVMIAELGRVADTAHVEHFRCLLGLDRGDTLIVDLAWEPVILYADYDNVHPGRCPVATVGTWHVHLGWHQPIWAHDSTHRIPIDLRTACFLSAPDTAALLLGPRLSIVQVNDSVICAWVKTGNVILPVVWHP
jgi:hypothetical protein